MAAAVAACWSAEYNVDVDRDGHFDPCELKAPQIAFDFSRLSKSPVPHWRPTKVPQTVFPPKSLGSSFNPRYEFIIILSRRELAASVSRWRFVSPRVVAFTGIWLLQRASAADKTAAVSADAKSGSSNSDDLEKIADAKAKELARPTPEWLPKPVLDIPEAKAADAAGMKAYVERVPGTDVKFKMVPIPGGKFTMGSPASEKGHAADEGPQHEVEISPFWMEEHEVTWTEYELWGLNLDKQRRKINKVQDDGPRRSRRCRGRADKPLSGDVVRHGQGERHAGDLHDAVRRQGLLPLALGQDGPLLPPAHRGRMGIRLPRRHEDGLQLRRRSRQAGRVRLVHRQQRRPLPSRGHEEAQSLGPVRHARQRRRVVHRPVYGRLLRQARAGKLTKNPLSPNTREYGRVVRGGSWDDDADKCRSAARRASEKDWKKQDPQIPQSIWYLTDATFVGFRVVRPLQVPTPEEAKKYEVDEDQLTAYKEYMIDAGQ